MNPEKHTFCQWLKILQHERLVRGSQIDISSFSAFAKGFFEPQKSNLTKTLEEYNLKKPN